MSIKSRVASKSRRLVADGVFFAEVNEFFARELAEEGYSGCEIKKNIKTEIIIRAVKTQDVLGEHGRRINELTLLLCKRFKIERGSLALYADRVQDIGLSAVAQAEAIKYKLLNGLVMRKAAYGAIKFAMDSGAKGCEVIISGKLRAARAKAMKFSEGFLIHSGQPVNDFIETATRHVLMRQGVLGIRVKIMRDPAHNKKGPRALPDAVRILEAKDEAPLENYFIKSNVEVEKSD
ncbi:40S ribosomal protein S3 [Hanseniaspora valbyensis]|uniref:Small ribosomal subunit protein uS3 n=1 Tax=Hanseniaspora valbyensis NRRL Y-1626 TaxID=766949 RepID=A0A1B7TBI9_9ASCO|nr:YNL178Wp-like protein [Hanseniaspora valbyensis NRRL Y-1626]